MKGDDSLVIDTRQMLAFGGGHVEAALNIGGLPGTVHLGGLVAQSGKTAAADSGE